MVDKKFRRKKKGEGEMKAEMAIRCHLGHQIVPPRIVPMLFRRESGLEKGEQKTGPSPRFSSLQKVSSSGPHR